MKITCDMCLDLMPLVKDGIASADSTQAVYEHIGECESCRALFDTNETEAPADDTAVLHNIKSQLRKLGLFILIFGAVIGGMMSSTMNMFHNLALMPILGGLGYAVDRKRWFGVLFLIFTVSACTIFVTTLLSEGLEFALAFASAGMYSLIYTGLAAVGMIIAALLFFAFTKEDKNEK